MDLSVLSGGGSSIRATAKFIRAIRSAEWEIDEYHKESQRWENDIKQAQTLIRERSKPKAHEVAEKLKDQIVEAKKKTKHVNAILQEYVTDRPLEGAKKSLRGIRWVTKGKNQVEPLVTSLRIKMGSIRSQLTILQFTSVEGSISGVNENVRSESRLIIQSVRMGFDRVEETIDSRFAEFRAEQQRLLGPRPLSYYQDPGKIDYPCDFKVLSWSEATGWRNIGSLQMILGQTAIDWEHYTWQDGFYGVTLCRFGDGEITRAAQCVPGSWDIDYPMIPSWPSCPENPPTTFHLRYFKASGDDPLPAQPTFDETLEDGETSRLYSCLEWPERAATCRVEGTENGQRVVLATLREHQEFVLGSQFGIDVSRNEPRYDEVPIPPSIESDGVVHFGGTPQPSDVENDSVTLTTAEEDTAMSAPVHTVHEQKYPVTNACLCSCHMRGPTLNISNLVRLTIVRQHLWRNCRGHCCAASISAFILSVQVLSSTEFMASTIVLSFKTYPFLWSCNPVVIADSNIPFLRAQWGNKPALQEILSEGRTSPYSVNDYGTSFLKSALETPMGNPTADQLASMHYVYSICGIVTESWVSGGLSAFEYALHRVRLGAYTEETVMTLDSIFHCDMQREAMSRGRLSALHRLVLAKPSIARAEKIIHENLTYLDARDCNGLSPLAYAISMKRVDIARILLEQGADPNLANDIDGRTPIFDVGCNKDALDLLLKFNASPSFTNLKKSTPLHLVANSQAYQSDIPTGLKIAQTLLEAGADPNVKDVNGWTPLDLALAWSQHGLVQLLIEGGASPNSLDANHRSPILAAIKHEQWNGLQTLVQSGADLNATNEFCMHTALEDAMIKNQPQAVQILLKHGANYLRYLQHPILVRRMTVLHLAARWCTLNMLEVLQEHGLAGLNPDLRDAEGHTAEDWTMIRGGVGTSVLREKLQVFSEQLKDRNQQLDEQGLLPRMEEEGAVVVMSGADARYAEYLQQARRLLRPYLAMLMVFLSILATVFSTRNVWRT